MNRRSFTQTLAGTMAGAYGFSHSPDLFRQDPTALANPAVASPDQEGSRAPFQLSVMLWTVFRDLPFEQRLEKVAEAGYKNVELVGEDQKWSEADYERANAKRKELGISVDATAGLKHGVANPADRNALLADLREALVSMEKLDCPSIILLS